jgi:tetratricopeptide (TPR) repeat protein
MSTTWIRWVALAQFYRISDGKYTAQVMTFESRSALHRTRVISRLAIVFLKDVVFRRIEYDNVGSGILNRSIDERCSENEVSMSFPKASLFFGCLLCLALLSCTAPENLTKPALAVHCFDNSTGDENLEYLGCGLSEWLVADLRQSKIISVLDKNRAREASNHIVTGSISASDGNYVVSAKLLDQCSGKIVKTIKEECASLEELPPFVDELTSEIKAALNLTPDQLKDDLDRDVGRITTPSPEAFRHYLDGMNHHLEGRIPDAISSYEKALEIDPEFALAHWRMGIALPSYDKKSNALENAIELTDRLSVRDFHAVQGDYHSMTRYRYARAMEAYESLLDLYPDDLAGRTGLGLVCFYIEEWEKAASQFRLVVDGGEERPSAYLNLARAYINPGLYDEAQDVLEGYLTRFGDSAGVYLSLIQLHRFRREYDLAHQVVDKAIALYPDTAGLHANKGDIYLYSGELDKAEAEYKKLIESPTPAFHAMGLYRLAELRLLQGKFGSSRDLAKQGFEEAQRRGSKGTMRDRLSFCASLDALTNRPTEAIEKLDALWETTLEDEELEWQRWVVYRKGLAYAETGQMDEALREAEELKGLIAKGLDQKKMRLYLHLMGVVELERKNYEKAAEYAEKSLPMVSVRSRLNIGVADTLASAYSGMGDAAKARKEYERMVTFPRGRQFYGDVYARSFYHLGVSFEAEGMTDKAIEYYEKFLDIWKDADPGIQELDSASTKLNGLRNR